MIAYSQDRINYNDFSTAPRDRRRIKLGLFYASYVQGVWGGGGGWD